MHLPEPALGGGQRLAEVAHRLVLLLEHVDDAGDLRVGVHVAEHGVGVDGAELLLGHRRAGSGDLAAQDAVDERLHEGRELAGRRRHGGGVDVQPFLGLVGHERLRDHAHVERVGGEERLHGGRRVGTVDRDRGRAE